MTTLRELAQRFGIEVSTRAPGELWSEIPEEKFPGWVAAIAAAAVLADLFATTGDGEPSLTAVFQVRGDPEWLTVRCRLSGDSFASITPFIHAASWYEREIREMHGLEPVGHPLPARLRLHDWPEGQPPMRAPVDERLGAGPGIPERVPMVRGRGVFQIPLGPVRSGPQESGEFLFESGGEDLVAVSPLLGYKFRAIERLAEGRTVEQGLLLAERLAGVSAFANGLAFVQAAERALGISVDDGARRARTLMNELERLHNHFGDIGRLADATGLLVAGAQYAALKEEVLRRARPGRAGRAAVPGGAPDAGPGCATVAPSKPAAAGGARGHRHVHRSPGDHRVPPTAPRGTAQSRRADRPLHGGGPGLPP